MGFENSRENPFVPGDTGRQNECILIWIAKNREAGRGGIQRGQVGAVSPGEGRQASAKAILCPSPPEQHSPSKILPLLSSAKAGSDASLERVCSGGEFGKDPPKRDPF